MRIGIVAGLPSDVERFEPVRRRLPGAEFLRPRGQWPSPHLDARSETDRSLAMRGQRILEEATADFDLVLARDSYSPEHVQDWLAPRGRLVAWRDSSFPARLLPPDMTSGQTTIATSGPAVLLARAEVAFQAVPYEVWRGRPSGVAEVVTGDPLAHGFFDVGAAARARGAMGLQRDARPLLVLLVESASGAALRWAAEIARLRRDYEVAIAVGDTALLDLRWQFPREWRGPRLHAVRGLADLSLADLLAAASVVLAEPGVRARLAFELGVPTLTIVDSPPGLAWVEEEDSYMQRGMKGIPRCEDRDHLEAELAEIESVPVVADAAETRGLHRDASARVADRLCAAAQLLIPHQL